MARQGHLLLNAGTPHKERMILFADRPVTPDRRVRPPNAEVDVMYGSLTRSRTPYKQDTPTYKQAEGAHYVCNEM